MQMLINYVNGLEVILLLLLYVLKHLNYAL